MFYAWSDNFDAVSFLAEQGLDWISGYCEKGFFPNDRRRHNCVFFCPDNYPSMSTKQQIECSRNFFLQHQHSLRVLKSIHVRMRLHITNRSIINLAKPENVFENILFDESFLAAVLPFLSGLDISVYVDAINFDELPRDAEPGG